MKIKKLLALLLIGVFLLCAFTACDTDPAVESSSDASAASGESGGDDSVNNSSADESNENPSAPNEGSAASDAVSASEGSSGGNSVPGPGSTKPSSGDTSTVEQMPHFNVKDYGAKATGKTDDAPAIKKAIEAAKKANGGIVYLPAGQYLMNSGVDVPMGVTVRGENPTTRKKWHTVSDLSSTKVNYESTGSGWLDTANFSGTWIIVNHGAGNVDAHATFQMEGNTSIYGLGFSTRKTPPSPTRSRCILPPSPSRVPRISPMSATV